MDSPKKTAEEHIQALKLSIERQDVENFLYDYLLWMETANSITIPTTLIKEKTLIEWTECLPNALQPLPPLFLDKLADYFISIATQLTQSNAQNLARNMIHIIQKTSYKKMPPISKKQGVNVKISKDYTQNKSWNPFSGLFKKKT